MAYRLSRCIREENFPVSQFFENCSEFFTPEEKDHILCSSIPSKYNTKNMKMVN
jgi:hypothetical protein